jgi:hypothetical protein
MNSVRLNVENDCDSVRDISVSFSSLPKSKYNNWLIAKLINVFADVEERRKKRAWLSYKQQVGHRCIGTSGS